MELVKITEPTGDTQRFCAAAGNNVVSEKRENLTFGGFLKAGCSASSSLRKLNNPQNWTGHLGLNPLNVENI